MGDDSPSSMIGSYRKYFKCSREEILWQISWTNMMLDLASIPSFDDKPNQPEDGEFVSPDDEEEELRKLLSQ